MTTISMKRGDTFKYELRYRDPENDNNYLDMTDWTARAEVRMGSKLTAELNVEMTDPANGLITLFAPDSDTKDWKIGEHKTDIEHEIPGFGKKSSPTITVVVEEDVTLEAVIL